MRYTPLFLTTFCLHAGGVLFGLTGCVFVSLWTTPVLAQSEKDQPKINNDLSIVLLTNKNVQKELNLTKTQVTEVTAPVQKLTADIMDLSFNPEYRDQPKKAREAHEKIKVEEKKLLSHLDQKQQTRLQQIFYQTLNIKVFQDTAVQKALQLTEDQKQKIEKIAANMKRKLLAMVAEIEKSNRGKGLPSKATRDANRKRSNGALDDAYNAINQILTAKQREQLKQLKGKPFDLYPGQIKSYSRWNQKQARSPFPEI